MKKAKKPRVFYAIRLREAYNDGLNHAYYWVGYDTLKEAKIYSGRRKIIEVREVLPKKKGVK